MAIIKRSDLARHIEELEARCEKLKAAVKGAEPNPNVYDHYALDPEQYKRDFVEVILTDVEYALSDFQTSLRQLGSLKKLQATKLKRS